MNLCQKVVGSLSLMGLLLAGCGGGSKSSNNTAPASASQMITAAAGGELEVGDTAKLNVPAGSLGADTTITAATSVPDATLPDQTTLKGQYFDFGPDGTTFNPPATLTLPASGTPPTGSKAVISWYDGTKWSRPRHDGGVRHAHGARRALHGLRGPLGRHGHQQRDGRLHDAAGAVRRHADRLVEAGRRVHPARHGG